MIASFPWFLWPTIPLIDLVERVGGVSGCDKSTQRTLVGKLLRCIFIGWIGPERDNTAVLINKDLFDLDGLYHPL